MRSLVIAFVGLAVALASIRSADAFPRRPDNSDQCSGGQCALRRPIQENVKVDETVNIVDGRQPSPAPAKPDKPEIKPAAEAALLWAVFSVTACTAAFLGLRRRVSGGGGGKS
jgi:hypothetical protein